MKNLYALVIVLLTGFRSHAQSIAPSVINSAGDIYKAGYYEFQWSIGEMALIGQFDNIDNKLTITNGFIQPYFHPVSPNPGGIFNYDEIRIFPNPASDHIEIDFLSRQKGRISVVLIDASGKTVYSSVFDYPGTNFIRIIPVTRFLNGVYIVWVNLDPEPGSLHKQGVYNVLVAH